MPLSASSIERRIISLDEQINDYFVKGMEQAIARVEKAGHAIPPFDEEKYSAMKEPEMTFAAANALDEAAIAAEGSHSRKKKEPKNKDLTKEHKAGTTAEGSYIKKEPEAKSVAKERKVREAATVGEGIMTTK